MHILKFIAKRVGMNLQYHCIKSQSAGYKVASSESDKSEKTGDDCGKLQQVCAIVYLTVAKFTKQISKRNYALVDCAKLEKKTKKKQEDSHVATGVN